WQSTGLQNRGLGVRFPPVLPVWEEDRRQNSEDGIAADTTSSLLCPAFCLLTSDEVLILKMVAVDEQNSFGGRARESVTGWWGRARRFLVEVRQEMGRVTWPSRKEVYATTFVVILFSVGMGVVCWGGGVVV